MKRNNPSITEFIKSESDNITHCIADRSYTWIYFINHEPIRFSRRIVILHKLLNDSRFIRCHKSYMVNLSYIKEYNSFRKNIIILKNNVEIKVSRRKLSDFKYSCINEFTENFNVNRYRNTVREKSLLHA